MASTQTQSQADAIRSSVSSISTCSSATIVALKSLLTPSKNAISIGTSSTSSDTRPVKNNRSRSTTVAGAPPPKGSSKKANSDDVGELSAKERATLATGVINATLRALGEAARPAAPASPSKRLAEGGEPGKTNNRSALRRSNSAPMTPLQPRSLNRVSTSPCKASRPTAPSQTSTSCLPTVECARVAFAALRALEASNKITLPKLQLDTGMSSFVGKLITLGFNDQAIKELRVLKERLESRLGPDTKRKQDTGGSEAKTQGQRVLADILDFRPTKPSDSVFSLVVATQIHALKILLKTKKPAQIEAALPILRHSHHSSPLRHLLAQAAEGGRADRGRVAQQLDTVAQIHLAITPSVSANSDGTATDSRLSISPATALELQTLGLEARMDWWKLAGHQGSVDKDILSPLSKCLAAYARRLGSGQSAYGLCSKSFHSIYERIQSQSLVPSPGSRHPLATIYQLLTSTARESGMLEEAIRWATALRVILDPDTDSVGKQCSVTIQLLSLQLKHDPDLYLQSSSLAADVVTGIQGSLRGDSTELEELLSNVCSLRRSVSAVLFNPAEDSQDPYPNIPPEAKQSLQSFILQCPRFLLRWLGNPPDPKSSTKDYLRYEQRRQLLVKSVHHNLDATFFLVKTQIEQQEMDWDAMESILADTLTLLQHMGEIHAPDEAMTFHVKISHFYYMKYSALRQQSPDSNNSAPLKALRRSVECMKDRPMKEREKAQFTNKLERVVNLSTNMGRTGEALEGLQTMRTHMIDKGVLRDVAAAFATRPPHSAWNLNADADVLSRALDSIAALEPVWINWAVDLPEAEQAAILEHRLWVVLLGSGNGSTKAKHCPTLDDPTVDSLLRIYNPTRFPIRRLRTLLRLLCFTVGNVGLQSDIRSVTADAVQLDENGNLGDDYSLKKYLVHTKTLYLSVTGLIDGYPDLSSVKQTVSTWKSLLVESNGSQENLNERIDNASELLCHLQSVADFLRMRGHEQLLATVLELAVDVSRLVDGPSSTDLLSSHADLALQYLNLGRSSQAESIFTAAETFSSKYDDLQGDITASFHLALADFLLITGNFSKANERMSLAKTAFEANQVVRTVSRGRLRLLFSYACYVYSQIALERGDSHHALVYCRESVRMAYQEWNKVESQFKSSAEDEDHQRDTASTTENSGLGTSILDRQETTKIPRAAGPQAWKIFQQMVRSLSGLSAVYDHLGMFQETLYYAETVEKMARAAQSDSRLLLSTAWTAAVYFKAGKTEKALESARRARDLLRVGSESSLAAGAACRIGSVYHGLGEFEVEAEMVKTAEAILATLASADAIPPLADAKMTTTTSGTGLESKMAKLDIDGKGKAVRKTRAATTTRRRAATPKATTKRTKSTTASAPPALEPAPALSVDTHLINIRSFILAQKAMSLQNRKEWAAATSLLQEIRDLVKLPVPVSYRRLMTLASCLLGQSLEDMTHDSVFSVVHDSTLSFPTVLGPAGDKERLSLGGSSSPVKTRNPAASTRKGTSKCPPSQAYLEKLREAQEYLVEAHSAVAVAGDSSFLHRISTMLQNVTLLLSTISSKSRMVGHAASSRELARNLTWRRERKALAQEKVVGKPDVSEWPTLIPASSLSESSRRSSLGPFLDLCKFQRDYVDIIPKTWTTFSIAVGEDNHDLCITRLQAGQSPFVIRLPLERASSRDADNEVFNFQQGRSELMEIIKLANETCHDARDMSVKGAKMAWWAEREALDQRLKELLELIERDWLGGFRGIFCPRRRHADRFAGFQKSFQGVLDKHLPSRRQVRGRKTKNAPKSKVALDPRILELFVGLGDATAEDCDFDDELTDLLYFVVDILQFHGERNAYDEIDFDSMVVEALDALRAYHHHEKGTGSGRLTAAEDTTHTILVLDKALHAFPWESLPCMQGLAVSRVPSLACLRQLILEQRAPSSSSSSPSSSSSSPSSASVSASASASSTPQQQTGENLTQPPEAPSGHHVSRSSGTYILNPSADLKTTQDTFDQALAAQLPSPSWTRVTGRAPTEAEFERALAHSDVLLYFGHGSGAQYIRGRTVRRLDRCRAAALLMGCSSASLAEAGEYEASGPVWNYLLAGCPAVVGTLWDVTDRDIDRLAGRALEEWGLLRKGTFIEERKWADRKKGKAKAKAKTDKKGGEENMGRTVGTSLVEAVARAREEACRFRYLTAAAVAVYGIPVYVEG